MYKLAPNQRDRSGRAAAVAGRGAAAGRDGGGEGSHPGSSAAGRNDARVEQELCTHRQPVIVVYMLLY